MVNPILTARFAEAIGERNKTDQQDAKLIARYVATQTPLRWQAPIPSVRTLRDLVRRLEALQDLEQQERNRLDVAASVVQPSIQAVLQTLGTEIKAIKAAIRAHIDNHPDLRDRSRLLDSIPGVGDATIRLVLSELPPEVAKSTRLADAFTGLAPRRHESGSSVNGRSRMSKQGSARIRKGMFLPAIVASQHNPVVMVFYQRMLANGLSKKAAICAAMRKLLHIIIGVLKSGKPFDPSLHKIA